MGFWVWVYRALNGPKRHKSVATKAGALNVDWTIIQCCRGWKQCREMPLNTVPQSDLCHITVCVMYVLCEELPPDKIKESKHTPTAAVKHTDQIVTSDEKEHNWVKSKCNWMTFHCPRKGAANVWVSWAKKLLQRWRRVQCRPDGWDYTAVKVTTLFCWSP